MKKTNRSFILISVRPRYIEKILSGQKRVEIRRIQPRVEDSATIVFYASSPNKQITALARLQSVQKSPPEELWTLVGEKTSLTKVEFFDYLTDCSLGVAISFDDVVKLDPPLSLSKLRTLWPNFHPPQSHIFLTHSQMEDLVPVSQ